MADVRVLGEADLEDKNVVELDQRFTMFDFDRQHQLQVGATTLIWAPQRRSN